LANEMDRFLPVRYRRLVEKNGYETVRASAGQVVNEVLSAIAS